MSEEIEKYLSMILESRFWITSRLLGKADTGEIFQKRLFIHYLT